MYRLLMSGVVLLILTTLAFPIQGAGGDTSGVVVDKARRTVTIPSRMAPRKINDPRYKEIYPLEVVACWPFPRGQKAHETVVTIEVKPSVVHQALVELGLKPGTPVQGEGKVSSGPEVNVYLEVPAAGGYRRLPIEKVMVDRRTRKALPKLHWRFTGSVQSQPDPNREDRVYGADMTGTLIAIFPVTDQTVLQTNLTMKEEKYVKLETDKRLVPAEGAPVRLVLEVPAGK